MTVAMVLSLVLVGVSFWLSVAGIGLNMIGRLFYSRFKPKTGISFWIMSFLTSLAIFCVFAYASKANLGDGVWW